MTENNNTPWKCIFIPEINYYKICNFLCFLICKYFFQSVISAEFAKYNLNTNIEESLYFSCNYKKNSPLDKTSNKSRIYYCKLIFNTDFIVFRDDKNLTAPSFFPSMVRQNKVKPLLI